MATTLWARLAPFNEKTGHRVRRYGFAGTMYLGGERPIWYKIGLPLARQLSELHQVDGFPQTPKLFQVYDETTRRLVDARENELRLAQLGLVSQSTVIPVPVREVDLSQGDPRGIPVPVAPSRAAALPKIPAPLAEIPEDEPVPEPASQPQPVPQAMPFHAPPAAPAIEMTPGAHISLDDGAALEGPLTIESVAETHGGVHIDGSAFDKDATTPDPNPQPKASMPPQPVSFTHIHAEVELPPGTGDLTTAQLKKGPRRRG